MDGPGIGSPLQPGDIVDQSGVIYIYDETGSIPNCTSVDSFVVTIIPSVELDSIPDVFTCDYYVLDTITGAHLSGNEEYEVNGTILAAGDTIFTTSTVFVYADTLGCGDTISFEVNITPAPILDPIADVEVCDMYVLEPCLLYTSPSPRD